MKKNMLAALFLLISVSSFAITFENDLCTDVEKALKQSTEEVISAQQALITKWNTENSGVSSNNQIMIPHGTHLVDYLIDWGDGSGVEKVAGVTAVAHTYAQPGEYTITIQGDFGIRFSYGFQQPSDAAKLITIEQWGNVKWLSMESAFYGCENLDIKASDVPDLSLVNDLSNMFANCSSLVGNKSFNHWNVSHIVRTDGMFNNAATFNQDISAWEVSNLESAAGMFSNASSFNQNIGIWKMKKIKSMGFMFHSATAFNQDISSWDVSNVYDMDYMFFNAISFNQDLSDWDISSLRAAEEMFTNTRLSQNNYDALLNGWATVSEGEGEVPRGIIPIIFYN